MAVTGKLCIATLRGDEKAGITGRYISWMLTRSSNKARKRSGIGVLALYLARRVSVSLLPLSCLPHFHAMVANKQVIFAEIPEGFPVPGKTLVLKTSQLDTDTVACVSSLSPPFPS